MRTKTLAHILAGTWLAATASFACSVPVFRYALERWPADAFELTVFHQGELTGPPKEVIEALNKAGEQAANLMLTTVDVSQPVPERLQSLWASNQTSALPLLTVQFPRADRIERPCWTGPLTANNARLLVDSPARRELAQRLLKGDSAVWLVLEGADPKANDQAVALLETELAKLQKEMQLPEPDPNDPRISNEVPLKIQFSVLRVARTDPAEQLFVAMLLGIHDALAKTTGPIVSPLYGRGRALLAFTMENLNADNIAQTALFLCGACSCEVKALNPGVDLLVAADWDGGLMGRAVKDPPLPPLVSLSELAAAAKPVAAATPAPAPAAAKPVAATTPAPAPTEPTGTSPLLRNVVIVLLVAIAVLAIASKALKSKAGN